jgi:hypothetical protein
MITPIIGLTHDDYILADQILAVLYPADTELPPRSAERYLRVWFHVVDRVEHGYRGVVPEYHNDLDVRDRLDALLRHAPQLLQDKLLAEVRPLDERFRAATYLLGRSVLPSLEKDKEQGWWWFRVPKQLSFSAEAESYYRADWERSVPELFAGPPRPPATSLTPGAVVTVRS